MKLLNPNAWDNLNPKHHAPLFVVYTTPVRVHGPYPSKDRIGSMSLQFEGHEYSNLGIINPSEPTCSVWAIPGTLRD